MIPSVYPLVGVLACLAILAAIALAPCLKAFRRGWFLVATVAAVLWAGTKPEPPARVFTFSLGLHDAGSTYDETEGAAVARWTYDAPVAGYAFRWQYRINGGPWVQLPDYAVTDETAVAAIPAEPGDEVRIQCYPQFIAPPHVITNGVYHLNGVSRSIEDDGSGDPKFVPFTIPIYADLSDGEEIPLTPTNRPPAPIMNATRQNEED